MTDRRLTDALATRVLQWRLTPNRYLKPDGGWKPRSRFKPLVDIRNAFDLLKALPDHTAQFDFRGRIFTAEIRYGGRTGRAASRLEARAISFAIARVLGINAEVKR